MVVRWLADVRQEGEKKEVVEEEGVYEWHDWQQQHRRQQVVEIERKHGDELL